VREASNLRRRHGDFAGDDSERAEAYRALVADPEVEAIFFARGGWGGLGAILDLLDADGSPPGRRSTWEDPT
jgi:muramoyltetrapeptide carboxypeptidase LdcA involved in peptidoglycan recycling